MIAKEDGVTFYPKGDETPVNMMEALNDSCPGHVIFKAENTPSKLIKLLGLAKYVSSWSKDPSTQVGAALMDMYGRILGVGYNGFPRNVYDDPALYEDRKEKYKRVVHAETNAIMNCSNLNIVNSAAIYPLMPCNSCAAQLMQLPDLYEIVVPLMQPARFVDAFIESAMLLSEGNVTICFVENFDG